MISEQQIKQGLENIAVPGVMRNLGKVNLVRNVRIADHKIDIDLAGKCLSEDAQKWLELKIQDEIKGMEESAEVNINLTEETPKDINHIKNVIAVMSGKGGVGKSLVSGLTAIALKRQGYEVGIMDADITGPSIPKMFGINKQPTFGNNVIFPVLSDSSIGVMSVNLLLPNEDEAVIWRGPLIAKMITQFWEDVLWGDLDYLVVDLPPGTADAPLTVLQQLSVSGIIIVFTPQDLTAMIVRKAVNMAKSMNKRIIGVVENMSFFILLDSGKKFELFGKSRGEEMAKIAGAPLLARFPIDPVLVELCDNGKIESYNSPIVDEMGQFISRITAD
ncbi:Mrp/NBP35 family ATP-binding protein [Chloroflexota bacterium]